jgi:hypothetical protein
MDFNLSTSELLKGMVYEFTNEKETHTVRIAYSHHYGENYIFRLKLDGVTMKMSKTIGPIIVKLEQINRRYKFCNMSFFHQNKINQ